MKLVYGFRINDVVVHGKNGSCTELRNQTENQCLMNWFDCRTSQVNIHQASAVVMMRCIFNVITMEIYVLYVKYP